MDFTINVKTTPEAVSGVPLNLLQVRINKAVNDFATETKITMLDILVQSDGNSLRGGTAHPPVPKSRGNEVESKDKGNQYDPVEPHFTLDKLIYRDSVKSDLLRAARKISEQKRLYVDWGLQEIDRNPKSAINLYGPPGTGKTAAAHALASHLSKKIIIASYADIESKYHGEGPKNVQALFAVARDTNSVLFIDEADSLLSQRLSNVTQGSEQAINSMRSQLLINMESHSGMIVFASNFAENYDRAFDTRLVHVEIPMPDLEQRKEIVRVHLPSKLPLSPDFSIDKIALVEGSCGRDIKQAIIGAAVAAIEDGSLMVSSDVAEGILKASLEGRKKMRIKQPSAALSESEKEQLASQLGKRI